MRQIILMFLCATLSLVCVAQTERTVNGVVFDEKGLPLAGAVIQPVGTDWKFNTEADGTFLILVPHYVKELSVGLPGFLSQTLEIDGSYLVFKLKVDKGYAQAKAKAEAEAKEEAERRARAEEAARLAAEKKAAEEAAAQARAEKAARIAAEKAAREAEEARLAAERKAAQEAAAQARAEEAARLAEEKRAAREAAAQAKAEKEAERKAAINAYNAKYKNKGIVHALEFSYVLYTGDPSEGYDVVYKNLGYRNYGSLHPVELKYTLGYRFNNWFSLGVGTGVQYQLGNLYAYGDEFAPLYRETEKYTPINIPVFLNARLYMSRGKYQPMLSLSGGVYAPLMLIPLFDAGAGLNVRLSKSGNMYFLVSVCSTPSGHFIEGESEDGYGTTNCYVHHWRIDPSFKLGFTF